MGLAQLNAPKIRILYNEADKTEAINWIDITINDFESDEADTLLLSIHWQSPIPRQKDNIKIYVDNHFLGSFVISTIRYNYKKSYEIEAISANFFESFKEKKNRTFLRQSYEQILRGIAKENGYNIKIDFARMKETGDIEQYDMSDCAFCYKIAKDLEITFCVKNNTLIFLEKDRQAPRVEYKISDDEIIDLTYQINHTKLYRACELKWFDTKRNRSFVAKAGKGTPILQVSDFARNKEEALKRAQARLIKQQNSYIQGTLTTHGVAFFAGGYINITLDDEVKNIRALITKITHKINNNWISTIEFC
ncbi:MAG: phage late control D family protein [Wolinella sp.]